MILTSYLIDLKRHFRLIGLIPGFIPYEYREGLIHVSNKKSRQIFYRLSLSFSVLHCMLMCLKLYVDKYELFLTLLGATLITGSLNALLIRWNWPCDRKFVDMFNELILYEEHLKNHNCLLKAYGGK